MVVVVVIAVGAVDVLVRVVQIGGGLLDLVGRWPRGPRAP